ncbi:hypothetical protein L596_030692 [Steinernema carpocapsae]|uniref:Uncharacterized protein n=1 Tax=Steinernema carpocapsae TaxID=34508 RepID=A0A4U5LNJ5_STECR|nr:hypothetical protein L596_030692 [Steinernema carpocapsae]
MSREEINAAEESVRETHRRKKTYQKSEPVPRRPVRPQFAAQGRSSSSSRIRKSAHRTLCGSNSSRLDARHARPTTWRVFRCGRPHPSMPRLQGAPAGIGSQSRNAAMLRSRARLTFAEDFDKLQDLPLMWQTLLEGSHPQSATSAGTRKR